MDKFIENEGPIAVALEIIPKKAFVEWLNNIEKELELMPTSADVLSSDTNIYLLSLETIEDEVEDYIEDHFEKIFKSELETWSIETKKWPKNRNYAMFNEWFEYRIHNLINMISVE